MKSGLSELVFILDKSGSMYELTKDTIGGFNSLLKKQKEESGSAFITTVLFDTKYKLFQNHVDVKDARYMTEVDYIPEGMTALYDALGKTIDDVGKRLSETPEEERPENVIFTIITDGYENSSREYTREIIKQKIEHQRTKYSWKFVFIGADIDSAEVASSIGVDSRFAKNYSKSARGTETVYTAMSSMVSKVRKSSSYATVDALEEDMEKDLGSIE